jgi:hypothetical protein
MKLVQIRTQSVLLTVLERIRSQRYICWDNYKFRNITFLVTLEAQCYGSSQAKSSFNRYVHVFPARLVCRCRLVCETCKGVQTKCSEKKFCDRAVQCSSILAPPLDNVTTESDIGTASETDNDLETNSNLTISKL